MKGAVIREFLLWYEKRYGRADVDLLVDLVPAHLKPLIDPSRPALGILGASWYPMGLTHPMLSYVVERAGNEGRTFALEANREIVPRMIRGVYRMLFKTAATPERYAAHVQRLWRNLHTTGERSMVIRTPGEALSAVERWPAHHPLLCWITIYTMAIMFETMGYKHWTVERVACVDHGGARCETVLRYRK